MNICRSVAVEKCYTSTSWGYCHSHSTTSILYLHGLNIAQFIGGNWLQTPLVSQVAISKFDTFGSKYTPPISYLDLNAVLLSFWGVLVINTSYLSSCYIFYFIFVFLPDSAPSLSLSTLSPSPRLSLPFSLLLLPLSFDLLPQTLSLQLSLQI